MKRLVLLFAVLAFAGAAHAQPRLYTQAELDTLLAPVALQPDSVLSQVLVAATFPEDVAAAAAWSRANPHLRGDDAVRAVEGEPWDPSVKALTAFPELLARMAESPEWLADLGQAFLAQEPQVMDTVQALRRRAQAAGHLSTTDDVAVYYQGEAIVVQPRTQVVYVRYYDPYIVYGPWWWPHLHPVHWHPWHAYPVVVSHVVFHSHPHWQRRHVVVGHRHWREQRRIVEARPHVRTPPVRVPESQRRPIVSTPHIRQAAPQPRMPAASGFSQGNRPRVEDRPRFEPRREHRIDSPRRERTIDDHSQRGGRHYGSARGNASHSGRAHARGPRGAR